MKNWGIQPERRGPLLLRGLFPATQAGERAGPNDAPLSLPDTARHVDELDEDEGVDRLIAEGFVMYSDQVPVVS